MDTVMQSFHEFFTAVGNLFSQFFSPAAEGAMGAFGAVGILLLHILTAVLAILIVFRCGSSLLRGKTEENWGFFSLANGAKFPLPTGKTLSDVPVPVILF